MKLCFWIVKWWILDGLEWAGQFVLTSLSLVFWWCWSLIRGSWNINYDKYLQSRAWGFRRIIYIWWARNKCGTCGATVRLEVHHDTYDRLGRERGRDCRVVCHCCHKIIHAVDVGWVA